MQILRALKILNKSKLWIAQPVSIFMKQLYSLKKIYGLTSLSLEWKTIITDWSQKGNKVTRNISKNSVCDMKVLPNGFFPQSYPKESHHNLKTVKGKVGKWQQGHEKLTHTGTYSWHLRKISFPSASWYIFPYTQLYWSRDAAERGPSTATCQQLMSLSVLLLLLGRWHENSFCH